MKAFALVTFGFAALWSASAAAYCDLPAGWGQVVGKQHYIVFGEVHGTDQPGRQLASIACALTDQHERLLMALELSDDPGLQRVWLAPHRRFAALVRAAPEWRTRDDGWTSRAVLALLVRLHALKAAGRLIDVTAFNDTQAIEQSPALRDLPGEEPHEAGQALNIRVASSRRAYDRVLVLVGNAHARKRPIVHGGVSYKSMVMRLDRSERIVSLFLATAGGSNWGCQAKGAPPAGRPVSSADIACGPHYMGADLEWTGLPRIVPAGGVVGAANPDGAYDATFYIGRVTASPPAVAR